jgi:signal peptidase I
MEEKQGSEPPPGWLRRVLIGRKPERTLLRIVIWVASLLIISRFILLPIRVQGASMLPTYQENGVNFVNRLAYVWSAPKRHDVVAIRLAGPHIMFMKRIIALPGETIAFRHGHAVVNGVVLNEPYVKLPCDWDYGPVRLTDNEYFFVGDNRSMPQVDHSFGRGERQRIVGKILL